MRRVPRAFTILEVMISIAILAMLTAALMTFGFSLGERRDRLMREGERGAMLSRVMDRVERVSASARRPASTGSSWLEIKGRGVWPEAGESGVPAGPVGFTGRLEFSRDEGELVWRETSELGEEVELVIGDVEAVLVDRFDDLVTTSGSRPPVRVSIWLAAVGRVRPAEPTEDELAGEMATLDALPLGEEDELPLRAADVVLVVADPMGVGS
ncbi:MAG: type II secretion system protein J [Phycisphaerales bacterium JB064]